MVTFVHADRLNYVRTIAKTVESKSDRSSSGGKGLAGMLEKS
ncbi:hypothetical protein LMG26854_02776 [Achromobacter aegrifaciens]|nr:hypothetical protein LMG26854_02776 [Achromobacter aegrifaciens]